MLIIGEAFVTPRSGGAAGGPKKLSSIATSLRLARVCDETPYTKTAEHLHLAPSSGNSLEAWTSYTVKLFISTNGSRRPHFTAAAGSEPATSRSENGYAQKTNERLATPSHSETACSSNLVATELTHLTAR